MGTSNTIVRGRPIELMDDGLPLTDNLSSLDLKGSRTVSAVGDAVEDNATGGGGADHEWSGQTTDATPTEIFIDGGATRLVIPANTTRTFEIKAVAGDNTSAKSWAFNGSIRRDGANNTSLGGAVKKTSFGEDDAASTWNVAVTADDTNEALIITVTGQAAKTIKWKAAASVSDVTF